MCFSACIFNRINRIVYSCPDPIGGATSIEPHTDWLKRNWPKVQKFPLDKNYLNLFVDYISNSELWSEESVELFRKLKPS